MLRIWGDVNTKLIQTLYNTTIEKSNRGGKKDSYRSINMATLHILYNSRYTLKDSFTYTEFLDTQMQHAMN